MLFNTGDARQLAGLLEGEGCFDLDKGTCPRIQLNMIDRDVVAWASVVLKHTGKIYQSVRSHNNPTYKDQYCIRVSGTLAVSWMMILYTFLGERRRAKIRSIIHEWKKHLTRSQHRLLCIRGHKFNKGKYQRTCTPCGRTQMRVWRLSKRVRERLQVYRVRKSLCL